MISRVLILDEKPLSQELQDRVSQAVQTYLDSLPHAPQAWADYQAFCKIPPQHVTSRDLNAVTIWSLIERRAQEVAQRTIEDAQPGPAPQFKFTLEGP